MPTTPLRPATLTALRRCTLDKLEERLGPLQSGLAALAPDRASRRERPYSVRRTWWCFLWQMLQRHTTCRQVVRQLQAMLVLEGRPAVDEGTSAYCQARARLPEPLLQAALKLSAQAAAERAAPSGDLQGRAVKVLDGTTLALPDTPENQAAYPQPSSQKPGCGFPLLHLVVVWTARGGAVLDCAKGDHHHSEMRLAQATHPAQLQLLWAAMLRVIATDLVPLRPDRWEPRAVKRRPKAYPSLSWPRHHYRELPHGSRYHRPAAT